MYEINYLFYDLSAVLALATLIIALIIRRLYKGRNNKFFLLLCVILFFTGILDIVTEYLDHFVPLSEYYTVVRFLLTTLYFASHNLLTPLYLLYITSTMGLWHRLKSGRTLLTYLLTIPYTIDVVLLIANIFNGKMFYYDSALQYVRGPWIESLYIVAFYYAVLTLVVLGHYRYLISSSWFWALGAMIPLNILAVFIQWNYHHFRIEIFMTTIMAILIAIIVHRPEDMVDDTVGMQSYKAFLSAVRTSFDAGSPTAYLMIRINNYRLLRRNLGMLNYVRLISEVASRINSICAQSDVVFETYYLEQGSFVVVCDMDKSEQLLNIGHIANAYLVKPIKLGHMEVLLKTCICLVKCPDDISTEAGLLNFEGTYNTKLPDTGSVICLSDQINDTNFRMRNDMDEIISRGIEGHKFMMYYQPIYNIATGRFSTAEALIRLIDIEYGFVSPGIFIPAAEESGAIHDIGDYVIDAVCSFIGSQDFKELGLEYIEINLSVAQCIETNLYDKVRDCMKRYGVRPDQVNLEITETAADYAPEITDRNIELLASDGIRFSLDDYGTGYSNVSRVVKLPLDIVKLDKSLVDDMDIPIMWTVIRNTVQMLKKMKKKVLVEGVEDKRAADKFTEIGCDYIQGFYFSKPLSEKDFLTFLREHNTTDESYAGA